MAKAEIVACAGAIFVLPDGRWVMQRRTPDAPTDASLLSFFGGKIEDGETPEQGFVREIGEETSIDLKQYGYSPAIEFEIPNYAKNGRTLKIWLYWVSIPTADFEVYEGTRAEAHQPADLAKRSDISAATAKALQIVTEKKHGA